MKVAIIGGTGIYNINQDFLSTTVPTPYGEVLVNFLQSTEHQKEIVFLPRHGADHGIPPHRINYRANIWALKELGISTVFAINAVGSMDLSQGPGSLTVFTDFIDATKNRVSTFYDGESGVVHTSVTDPYCSNLRNLILQNRTASELDFKTGVYVCTEGPRFETAAEINMYHQWGAQLVGMTGVPEVVLAKELGICYAGIGIVTNWATGIAHDHQLGEIMGAVDDNRSKLIDFLLTLIEETDFSQDNCQCSSAKIALS